MQWKNLKDIEIPAKPEGVWTLAVAYVEGVARLKIEAKGTWSFGGGSCGPDGAPSSLLPREKCLIDKAPVGALIGKLGGSTAGLADGHLFVVGRSCVLHPGTEPVPATGPLYLTINDLLDGLSDNSGVLNVTIEDGTQLGEAPVKP